MTRKRMRRTVGRVEVTLAGHGLARRRKRRLRGL
jgi:hypothetical protein